MQRIKQFPRNCQNITYTTLLSPDVSLFHPFSLSLVGPLYAGMCIYFIIIFIISNFEKSIEHSLQIAEWRFFGFTIA